jgi:tripartite-type tricarboxylate transporter receptor subunit TctC
MTMKALFGFAIALFCTVPALAQNYPTRAITIVNPNATGGQVDLTMRPLIAPLERILKQTIILTNRPGAAGAAGLALVANAAPDGYTLVATSPAIDTIPFVDKLFGRPPAFAIDQFIGVAMFNADPTVLVVPPSLPTTTAREFIAYVRQHPGDVIASSSGAYGATHLPIAMLELAENLRFRNLITAGGGPAMVAVLEGQAQAYAAPPGVAAPHVATGKVRALAHWGKEPHPSYPGIPSFQDLGVNVEYYFWIGLFAPVKTPPAVLQRLHEALRLAVSDPEFTAAMEKLNLPITYRDGAAFNAWWRDDIKRLSGTIEHMDKIEESR